MAYFPYESAIWAKLTGEGSYLIGMTSAGTGHLRPETLLLRWITYMASKLVLPIGWELSWGYLSGASVPLHVSLFKRRLEKKKKGTSLVAQWLRICLPMQGTRVQSLVQEDPTCRGATKPVSHNY